MFSAFNIEEKTGGVNGVNSVFLMYRSHTYFFWETLSLLDSGERCRHRGQRTLYAVQLFHPAYHAYSPPTLQLDNLIRTLDHIMEPGVKKATKYCLHPIASPTLNK